MLFEFKSPFSIALKVIYFKQANILAWNTIFYFENLDFKQKFREIGEIIKYKIIS